MNKKSVIVAWGVINFEIEQLGGAPVTGLVKETVSSSVVVTNLTVGVISKSKRAPVDASFGVTLFFRETPVTGNMTSEIDLEGTTI